ncbi:MAG: RNA polymerase sigma factor [Bacteroidales bacterium]|nr:RNA polymerase sigma factor [Bacteroidales bacterium]MBN2764467.1 RNA polymerase sigma factor [Bacteroidales bacterium]
MTVEEYNKTVDDHADGLYRFILKNTRDSENARDIVQDSFEKLWIRISSVDAGKAKSYLFTTAYHTMIDMIRKNKRTHGFDIEEHDSESRIESYTGISAILEEAVNLLPVDQRSVILLRDYEGYRYDEIANITGLSESQVKVYIFRARMFLKKYIGSIETLI